MKLLNEFQAWKVIARAWKKYSQTGHVNKIIRKDGGLCFSVRVLFGTGKINKNTYLDMNVKIFQALPNKKEKDYSTGYLFDTGRKYAKLRAEFAKNKSKETKLKK